MVFWSIYIFAKLDGKLEKISGIIILNTFCLQNKQVCDWDQFCLPIAV